MSENETAETPTSRPPLPPPTFDFLVMQLIMQAQMALGLLRFGQEDEGSEPDFEMAQHHIDLLGVIQEKTRGNLTLEEQRTLENSLTELRFRFVQARAPKS